jgi:hypothetical protein
VSNTPAGLGDGGPAKELVLEHFTAELPNTRPLIIKAISAILDLGAVQKVVLEVKKPLEYWRLVPKTADLPEVPDTVETEDLYAAIMNAPAEELLPSPGGWPNGSFALLSALSLLADKGLIPMTFMVNNMTGFYGFVGGTFTATNNVAGVPVRSHGEIPDDVFLLAAKTPDSETVTFSLKVIMELKKPVVKGKRT